MHLRLTITPSLKTRGIEKLIAMCVQEEERIKDVRDDFINHVKHNKKKNFFNSPQSKRSYSHDYKTSSSKGQDKTPMKEQVNVPKGVCRHCKQEGHYMRDCVEFLKWLNMCDKNKCKNLITSIDESLYLDYSSYTWWIDSGATIHIVNSLQRLSMRRTLPKGERTIRVANGKEAEVEAIGELPLEISNDFTLYLHDVFYVPSMRRNLIYVSCLDDDGFDYLFSKKKCLITFNDEVVGRALRHDKLYLLSIKDFINVISFENNVNVSSSKNKRKRINDVSSKLWHRRLGHISRGRIERLVKESILPSLEFSNFEQCIDCIKGKYVKQIKKNVKRSVEILEIIHTDTCGPFPIASVDGYDSFIIFTNDYSRYGYIYPIKEQSEVLDKFKIFKAEVENQYDIEIKIVRSDRGGGEYYGRHTPYGQISGPFARFLQKNGIVAQYFMSDEPQ
jgi:hypothetical protein